MKFGEKGFKLRKGQNLQEINYPQKSFKTIQHMQMIIYNTKQNKITKYKNYFDKYFSNSVHQNNSKISEVSMMDCDQNEEQNNKQKCYYRMLQLYYNSNLSNLSNMLKKCIPDLDLQNQNRYIRKNDKVWVQVNLPKIYENACDKIETNALSRNICIKNTIQTYQTQFQKLKPQLKRKIIEQGLKNYKKPVSTNKLKKRSVSYRNSRKNTIQVQQNLISQPSIYHEITMQRNSLTSKRLFRVREYRKNLDQIINNDRYMEKLERVKLQSTFTEFYFQKDANPEDQWKNIQNQPRILNKLKAMTNIRCNFINSQNMFHDKIPHNNLYPKKPQNFFKDRDSQSFVNEKSSTNNIEKMNNLLGLQIKKQNLYKPKSKCKQRKNKLFLNF